MGVAYIPAVAIHRLYVALDDAAEEYEAAVNLAFVYELHEAWRAGLPKARSGAETATKTEPALVRRRHRAGRGKPTAPVALPKGKIVAVAWREAGSEAITLLIGKWVLASADDGLRKRAANAVECLCTCARGGAHGERQQACATEWEGGVALIRQLPNPKVELWDVDDERD